MELLLIAKGEYIHVPRGGSMDIMHYIGLDIRKKIFYAKQRYQDNFADQGPVVFLLL